ncbi:unnamed protein product [Fusarium graminearum]|nr:unnamed protein product [Fusarium graminearum]VTO89891.1 unnamed protein product [Fusarium graminearum]
MAKVSGIHPIRQRNHSVDAANLFLCKGSSSKTWSQFVDMRRTTIGDPTTAWRALQLRMDALGCIVDMAKFNQAQSQRLFTTWLPSISTYIQYDDDDTTPTHLS